MSEELLNELTGGDTDGTEQQSGAANSDQLSAEQGKGGEAGTDAEGGAANAGDKQSGADTGGGADKTVPLATLLEERKQFQQKLAQMEEQNRKYGGLEQQIREMREAQAKRDAPAPKADEPPDYLQDPKGYVDWVRKQAEAGVQKELEPLKQAHQQTEQQRQQEAQIQQVVSKASEFEAEFTKTNPRYMDALGHIRQLRMAEAEALGIPQAHALQALRNQELQLAAFALTNNKNPAELAYNLAIKLGFNPESNASTQANGKTPEQLEQERLDTAAKKDRAQSMGGQGGADVSDILEANNDEFEAAMQSIFGKR